MGIWSRRTWFLIHHGMLVAGYSDPDNFLKYYAPERGDTSNDPDSRPRDFGPPQINIPGDIKASSSSINRKNKEKKSSPERKLP